MAQAQRQTPRTRDARLGSGAVVPAAGKTAGDQGIEGGRRAAQARLAYSIEEAAEVLGLGVSTVRTLMSTDRLEYTTAGSRVLISRAHIEAFLASTPERRVNRPGYRVRGPARR